GDAGPRLVVAARAVAHGAGAPFRRRRCRGAGRSQRRLQRPATRDHPRPSRRRASRRRRLAVRACPCRCLAGPPVAAIAGVARAPRTARRPARAAAVPGHARARQHAAPAAGHALTRRRHGPCEGANQEDRAMNLFRNLLFWILLALLGAIAAQLLLADPGYVLVRFRGYDYETTVATAVLATIVVLVALWLLWKLLTLPFRSWRRHRDRRSRARLGEGLDALHRGHYDRAEKLLVQA